MSTPFSRLHKRVHNFRCRPHAQFEEELKTDSVVCVSSLMQELSGTSGIKDPAILNVYVTSQNKRKTAKTNK